MSREAATETDASARSSSQKKSKLRTLGVQFVRASKPGGASAGSRLMLKQLVEMAEASLEKANRRPNTRPEEALQFAEGMLDENFECIQDMPEPIRQLASVKFIYEALRDTMWNAIGCWEQALKGDGVSVDPVLRTGTQCLTLVPILAQVEETRMRLLQTEGFLTAFVTLASANPPTSVAEDVKVSFMRMGTSALSAVFAWLASASEDSQRTLGANAEYVEGALDALENSVALRGIFYVEEALDSLLDLAFVTAHRHDMTGEHEDEQSLCVPAFEAIIARNGVKQFVLAWNVAMEKRVRSDDVDADQVVTEDTCRVHIVMQTLHFLSALVSVRSLLPSLVTQLSSPDVSAIVCQRLADALCWDSWRSRSVRESIEGSGGRVNAALTVIEALGVTETLLLARDRRDIDLLRHVSELPRHLDDVMVRKKSSVPRQFIDVTAPALLLRVTTFLNDVVEPMARSSAAVRERLMAAKAYAMERTSARSSRRSSIASVAARTRGMSETVLCSFCGESKGKLRLCTGCMSARYCGVKCQRAHWRAHMQECRVPAATSRKGTAAVNAQGSDATKADVAAIEEENEGEEDGISGWKESEIL